MIRVKPKPEPATFDKKCRQKGLNWLRTHPIYKRPRDYWSQFEPDLRRVFSERCGYCAMWVMKAQVDHFVPIDRSKKQRNDRLAYEWSKYRYGEGVMNQKKSNCKVLDPFEVRDNWFELLLPSLQLVLTARVPAAKRKLAEFTLKRLGLRDGEVVVRCRREWFRLYQTRQLKLEVLKKMAPQIAAAVERDLATGIDWRLSRK
ncbi:MAG: hypothetical protein NT069_19460 [Planctomycetota bacterium]|nr:hypothetical protein [Planctomycetota bacterium]